MHVHGAILGFIWVRKDADDGLTDGGQGSGAENALAAVIQVDAFGLEVDDEPSQDTPVKEWPRGDEGVGQPAGGSCFFLERILDGDFVLEDGESGGFLYKGVGSEFGWNEAFDMCFGSRFY